MLILPHELHPNPYICPTIQHSHSPRKRFQPTPTPTLRLHSVIAPAHDLIPRPRALLFWPSAMNSGTASGESATSCPNPLILIGRIMHGDYSRGYGVCLMRLLAAGRRRATGHGQRLAEQDEVRWRDQRVLPACDRAEKEGCGVIVG